LGLKERLGRHGSRAHLLGQRLHGGEEAAQTSLRGLGAGVYHLDLPHDLLVTFLPYLLSCTSSVLSCTSSVFTSRIGSVGRGVGSVGRGVGEGPKRNLSLWPKEKSPKSPSESKPETPPCPAPASVPSPTPRPTDHMPAPRLHYRLLTLCPGAY